MSKNEIIVIGSGSHASAVRLAIEEKTDLKVVVRDSPFDSPPMILRNYMLPEIEPLREPNNRRARRQKLKASGRTRNGKRF